MSIIASMPKEAKVKTKSGEELLKHVKEEHSRR